jgi:hypothetical protein
LHKKESPEPESGAYGGLLAKHQISDPNPELRAFGAFPVSYQAKLAFRVVSAFIRQGSRFSWYVELVMRNSLYFHTCLLLRTAGY